MPAATTQLPSSSSNSYGAHYSAQPPKKKPLCKQLENEYPCRLKDTGHLEKYDHPKHLVDKIDPSPRPSKPISTTTTTPSVQYINSTTIGQKKRCPDWSQCKQTKDDAHKNEYYHPCRNGINCNLLGNQSHIHRFVHPCAAGTSCNDTSALHKLQFHTL